MDVSICKDWANDFVFDKYWIMVSSFIVFTYLVVSKWLLAKFVKEMGFIN